MTTYKTPVDFREGFVDDRFKSSPPPKTYKLLPSLLSIASLIVMTQGAIYMSKLVGNPAVSFHLVKTEKPRRGKAVPPEANTFEELMAEAECFFPGVLYDTKVTDPGYFEQCNRPLDITKTSIETTPPLWSLLPFYFTIWGAGLGGAFEIVLVLVGKAFQQNFNPLATWVSRLRLLNLAFVSTSIFFLSACLTIPSNNSDLLQGLMYFFTALAFALAPALFFGGFTAGGFDFLPPTLLGLQVAQFVFVVSRGAVFGGKMATFVLALAPALQFTAFLVTTATPLRSTAFHVLSTLAGFALYISLLLSGNEAPSFLSDIDMTLEGPKTTHVGPLLVVSAAFGWTAMMTLAPRVYQYFRSELSYYVWSTLYYVLVGAPSQPLPLRLSAIFDNQVPRRITVQPYSAQHPYYVSTNLGIPAINGYVKT